MSVSGKSTNIDLTYSHEQPCWNAEGSIQAHIDYRACLELLFRDS